MICNDTTERRSDQGQDPVAAVMGHLATGDGRPDLTLLAHAIVAALPRLPHARQIAVRYHPERATRLDENWGRNHDNCLVVDHAGSPRWAALHGGWPLLEAALANAADEVVAGQGEVPGGRPWPDDPAVDHGRWCLLPVTVAGQLTACVLLETEPQASAVAAAAAALVAVGRAVKVVTDLWGISACMHGELSQAQSEKESLTRLNHLQGRFVAMASHEFKTPLTSITAYTDVLRSQLTDEQFPHASEFLDVIKAEADRLLRMVNRVLDFTRMEYGTLLMTRQPTELEPLVVATVRGLQPAIDEKKLQVEIRAHAHLPRAEVDPDLIRQVLVNLLGNAVKFTPPEGKIIVTIKEVESAVSISVADDGPGIPAEDIRRIFREFYRADGGTAREEGSGLGLTIARHIVNLHGGHIEVRRRRAGGADFRFMVPKETGTGEDVPLPVELGPKANPAEVRILVDELLRLVAELTGSRAVALLMRDGRGALMPAGAMGWEVAGCKVGPIIENEAWTRFMQAGLAASDPDRLPGELNWCLPGSELNQYMVAPLGSGESILGLIVAGRRREKGNYAQVDLAQLTILADVATAALYGVNTSAGRAVEAVRLLLKIRRTGVPTSTPVALDLLAKLAKRMSIGETGTRRIQYAAALHDAGMARVEDEIVQGGDKLNVDERDEVERHVEQGVELMGPLLPDDATTDIMRHHHEKFDGSGYPAGLKADAIPLGSRLLAVIDAWFSLTRERPFRDGLAPQTALAEISAHAGSQFDPAVVQEFQAVLVDEGIVASSPVRTQPNAT